MSLWKNFRKKSFSALSRYIKPASGPLFCLLVVTKSYLPSFFCTFWLDSAEEILHRPDLILRLQETRSTESAYQALTEHQLSAKH